MQIVTIAYDHPDAQKLIAEVQQEYVVRYGEPDVSPVDPEQFAPPQGQFYVGYSDGVPVACGGWRAHDGPAPDFQPGDAEMKRLYVSANLRGNGLSRRMLAELERSAADAGRTRMVLETGVVQPEAIGLYTASGYTRIPKFGYYKHTDESICFAKHLR